MSTAGNLIWRLFLLPFACLPLVFVGAAAVMLHDLDRKFDTYRPVDAVVESTSIKAHSAKHGNTYSPEITYHYFVNDRKCVSTTVMPVSESRSYEWASAVIQRYPPGSNSTAWYDPGDPTRSFLIRFYSPAPALIVMFSMLFVIFFTGGVGGAVISRWRLPEPALGADGLYELKPTSSIGWQWKIPLLAAVIWYGVGLLVCTDYFVHTGKEYQWMMVFSALVYSLLGLVPLRMFVKKLRVSERMGTPRVRLSSNRLRAGDVVTAAIDVDLRDTSSRTVTAGFICEMTTGGGKTQKTSVYWDGSQPCTFVPAARMGMFAGKMQLKLPDDAPDSTNRDGARPRYAWKFQVKTEFEDGIKWNCDFRVSMSAKE